MKQKFQRFFVIFSVHLILVGTLLAGIRVCKTGYNRMHPKAVQAVGLHVSGSTAEFSILTRQFQVPLPRDPDALRVAGYLLVDDAVRVWVWLLGAFIK